MIGSAERSDFFTSVHEAAASVLLLSGFKVFAAGTFAYFPEFTECFGSREVIICRCTALISHKAYRKGFSHRYLFVYVEARCYMGTNRHGDQTQSD